MTPFRALVKYNLTLIQAGQDRDTLMNFLRMEKWLADRPDHSGAAAQQWLKELYQDNKLFRGEFVIDGRFVDLGAVVMPVLNIYSETDTIIHPLASRVMPVELAARTIGNPGALAKVARLVGAGQGRRGDSPRGRAEKHCHAVI